jgi:hypothetical protein
MDLSVRNGDHRADLVLNDDEIGWSGFSIAESSAPVLVTEVDEQHVGLPQPERVELKLEG